MEGAGASKGRAARRGAEVARARPRVRRCCALQPAATRAADRSYSLLAATQAPPELGWSYGHAHRERAPGAATPSRRPATAAAQPLATDRASGTDPRPPVGPECCGLLRAAAGWVKQCDAPGFTREWSVTVGALLAYARGGCCKIGGLRRVGVVWYLRCAGYGVVLRSGAVRAAAFDMRCRGVQVARAGPLQNRRRGALPRKVRGRPPPACLWHRRGGCRRQARRSDVHLRLGALRRGLALCMDERGPGRVSAGFRVLESTTRQLDARRGASAVWRLGGPLCGKACARCLPPHVLPPPPHTHAPSATWRPSPLRPH